VRPLRHHVRQMPTASTRFRLISGNRLDRLAGMLGERLASPLDVDSLAADVILIPQPTLRHWLLQTLAERHGVAANLDLCTPSEFVWRLLRADRPGLPDLSPWDRDHLRWRLYALLGADAGTLPQAVRRHLQRAGGSGDPREIALARLGLADALAGAFDKYQAYRPDWLRDWELRHPDSRDDWQAQLWRQLRRRQPDAHRAALLADWLARHDRESATATGLPPSGLPPRLVAFGTIHVSPDVLHLLAVVGQWIDLDFHLPTPSAEYWGDVESLRARLRREGPQALPAALADAQRDNPLLMAWGAGGREIVAQLFAYDVLLPHSEIDCFVAPGRDTLLHRLQQDVLDRAAPQVSAFASGDVSLQLHACHSKLREVEVLHDQLRGLLDDALPDGRRFDPPLQPSEIAVLAPDIAEYLPLARAVFGGIAPDDPRWIPFSLADRPQVQSHPLVPLLPALIGLADTPLTAGAFRDLLATPSVSHALALDDARRAKIDDWFEAAGVRWGEDAQARERAGAGRWREYSFEFGIERLLGGYAAGDDAMVEAGSEGMGERTGEGMIVAPYPELEGADAEVLDRALLLYRRLRAFAAWARESHDAAAWHEQLAALLQDLLAPVAQDEAEAQARRLLLETLDDFAAEAAEAGPLPAVLVQRTLRDALERASPHRPWLSGGVVFAGMVPLRTVPFRVICLLGLDADAYPRREPGDDINRLVDAIQGRAPRRLGDRSVREDDRFLFLQLLCAAGDVFYLSYGGRDARDGSVREPSPVVAELLDAVEAMHGEAVRDALCVEHPLQPFSPRAFGAGDEGGVEPRRFSYRSEWRADAVEARDLRAAPAFVADTLLIVAPDALDDDLPDRDALQRFFANPAKAWLRGRLGLRLPETADAAPDREPLGHDRLLRYQVLDALLGEAMDADPDSDAVPRRLRARGLLPPGRDGEQLAADACVDAASLRNAGAAAIGDAPATVIVGDAGLGIDVRFDDVHDGRRVIASAGRLDGKRILRAGIDHLLLASALGETASTRLLGLEAVKEKGKNTGRKKVVECVWSGVSQDQAQARLRVLLDLWRDGQTAPLPFAPKAAHAYAESFVANGDAFAAWRKAFEAFAPYEFPGESKDPWLRLAFRPDGLLDAIDGRFGARFREIAVRVFETTGLGA
jgi:exodeoxyribonuclease V gamma subunit